jgi:hypothetical protein
MAEPTSTEVPAPPTPGVREVVAQAATKAHQAWVFSASRDRRSTGEMVADAVLPALHDHLKAAGYLIVHRDILADAMAALDDLGACADPCCKDPECGRVVQRLNTVLFAEEIAAALAELTSIIHPTTPEETRTDDPR